ncbi:uncharacterized protein MKK02DRAFT_32076 [Dioszegia hungarica]|uniref:Uncharacterized protein n=1 Tax=Dioszegia hungarica TaxID=4972 RepID=A0AA38HDY5_9TREE|nr:uncharacterized protein MKK02DRAFT_32076 [Dioszegia hungarica]KAI9638688.1 hypothetical protein MKK02DRAFT_32076 [Dioszegia hungarica]
MSRQYPSKPLSHRPAEKESRFMQFISRTDEDEAGNHTGGANSITTVSGPPIVTSPTAPYEIPSTVTPVLFTTQSGGADGTPTCTIPIVKFGDMLLSEKESVGMRFAAGQSLDTHIGAPSSIETVFDYPSRLATLSVHPTITVREGDSVCPTFNPEFAIVARTRRLASTENTAVVKRPKGPDFDRTDAAVRQTMDIANLLARLKVRSEESSIINDSIRKTCTIDDAQIVFTDTHEARMEATGAVIKEWRVERGIDETTRSCTRDDRGFPY